MPKSLPPSWEDVLIWCPEKGMGFHPREPMSYEGSYFEHYRELDKTDMGKLLTGARCEFVRKHFSGTVLDIGIGGGRFVEESDGCGFDVSQEAVKWLKETGRFFDPYVGTPNAITCWDSLEHIPEPEKLINRVESFVFVSIPIFNSPLLVSKSKHFKPGEHLWYFTDWGLVKWFKELGFKLIDHNQRETLLGREGIMSFAFEREHYDRFDNSHS